MVALWRTATPTQKRIAVLVTAGTILTMFLMMFLFGNVQAYADVFDVIHDKFAYIYTRISVVITGVAVVAIAICALRWVFDPDPGSKRMAKQWLLSIVIGLALYWGAWLIINFVRDAMSGYSAEGG